MYKQSCALCLLKEEEISPFLEELKKSHPLVEITFDARLGSSHIHFQSKEPLEPLIAKVQEQFPSFYYGEGNIEEALAKEFITRKKTLALAESCTGGSVAAKLVSMPGASKYLAGSIVAYSNEWKERFLQVSRTTLQTDGAESKQAVIEMASSLLSETEADFVAAISGVAGPSSTKKAVGTVYIAIGKKGEKIDAGMVFLPQPRGQFIEQVVHITLGALWRRLVHNTKTFS